ncbi:MAG: acylglycerol kinase family protein, partial [Chloroflexota bacterium]
MKTTLIANYLAARRCAADWCRIESCAKSNRLLDCNILMTESLGQATELARQAAASGCDMVVAVGGDGTINEVLNGLFH